MYFPVDVYGVRAADFVMLFSSVPWVPVVAEAQVCCCGALFGLHSWSALSLVDSLAKQGTHYTTGAGRLLQSTDDRGLPSGLILKLVCVLHQPRGKRRMGNPHHTATHTGS